MKLIVGLGNPGPKYETTRHNAGFLILDEVAERFGISWSGEKFQGIVGKGRLFEEDCVLLKPTTFMNLSGRSVREAMQFFKIPEAGVIVVHDEIDVEPGKVKARVGGGAGGHNGIRSIIAEAGMANFHRIKVGVGRPPQPPGGDVSGWVLGPLSDQEILSYQGPVLQEVLMRLENIFKGTNVKNHGDS